MIIDMNNVSRLTKVQIRNEARQLLDQWSGIMGQRVNPPIPVEAIVEKCLGLTIEYDDLEEMLGISDVHGAAWVESNKMVINNRLSGEFKEIFGRWD